MISADPKQICLIEDHQDYRRVLQLAIQQSDHLECDLTFSSIEACLEKVPTSASVDVILLDLGLPGMHGVTGIPILLKHFPAAKILVITVYDHKPVVLEALAVGASGYLLKSDHFDTILRGIDEVISGGAPLNSHIARMILTTFNAITPATPETDLTDRERETLSLLVNGFIKKEIAEQLGVSYHTVDTHVRNIYGKLQVHNLSGAVAKAMRLGLI